MVRRLLAVLALLALIFAAPLVGVVLVGAVAIAVVHDRHGPARRQAPRVIGARFYELVCIAINYVSPTNRPNYDAAGRWSGENAWLRPSLIAGSSISI